MTIPLVVDLTEPIVAAGDPAAVDRLRIAIAVLLIERRDLWQHDPVAAALLEAELMRRLFPASGGKA